jgi:hypothetical protein
MARPTGAPERVTIDDPTPAVIRELDIPAARGDLAGAWARRGAAATADRARTGPLRGRPGAFNSSCPSRICRQRAVACGMVGGGPR